MRRAPVLLALTALSVTPLVPAARAAITATGLSSIDSGQLAAAVGSELLFVANGGQWEPDVRFRADIGGAVLWVTDDSVVYDFSVASKAEAGPDQSDSDPEAVPAPARRGHVVAMRFDGARAARVVGRGEQATYRNYFAGSDPSSWASRVPVYDEVVLEGLYDGVDLRLYSDAGLPRYDLVLAAGADLSQVRMRLDGADNVTVSADGTVTMQTSLGPVEQRGLVAYQSAADGAREVVPSAFRLATDGSLSFVAEGADELRPLVVDPLIWSTFLGGSDFDSAAAIDVRADGSVVVAGSTWSPDFPTTPGAYDNDAQSENAFVSVLSADGSDLLYSTYFGSSEQDGAWGVAAGADGTLTVVGGAGWKDFPVTAGAFDTTFSDGREFAQGDDGFVTRLSADGSSLIYSTFLGGVESEFAHELALAADGTAWVAGSTYSDDFPVTEGALDTGLTGTTDGFVSHLSADGSDLLTSTYLGGSSGDQVRGIRLAADGAPVTTGSTGSADFTTTQDAYDQTLSSGDAFITRLSLAGDSINYSTFFGGSSSDTSNDLAIGPDGSITIVGETKSKDLPTGGGFDATHNGLDDAFVAQLSPDGRSLVYASYLGGGSYDDAGGVAVGADGTVTVAGRTAATSRTAFPTTPNAFDRELGGSEDAFVTRLSLGGSSLLYSTLIGGSGTLAEQGTDIALTPRGTAILLGFGDSTDYPTTPGAYQPFAPDGVDAFVTQLDLGSSSCPLTIDDASLTPNRVAPGESVTVEVDITNPGPGPRSARLELDFERSGGSPKGSAVIARGTVPQRASVIATVTLRIRPNAPVGTYALDLRLVDGAGTACDSASGTLVVEPVRGAGSSVRDELFETPTNSELFAVAGGGTLGGHA